MQHKVSAFAAINGPPLPRSMAEIDAEEEEEIVIKYEAESDSSVDGNDDNESPIATNLDSELDDGQFLGAPIESIVTTTATSTTAMTSTSRSTRLPSSIKPLTVSNFKPNDDNLVFDDKGNHVTIGLKKNEHLLIRGQYSVVIQRGCLRINTVLYHASPIPMKIIAPAFMSLPVLYADQVIDQSLVTEERNEANQHLFSSEYKTILKISNLFTGLETIGQLYPSLRNVFPNNTIESDEIVSTHPFEVPFEEFSFQPVFQDYGFQSSVSGHLVPKPWTKHISRITQDIINANKDITEDQGQARVLVIGSKNSGKSTFIKTLLNDILYNTDHCMPVNIMDLDPGQPEFSQPDSISISQHSQEVLGLNITPYTSDKTNNVIEERYVGYANPNKQPVRYGQLCDELCDYYDNKLHALNQPVIINTPGWIKGYGIEVLQKISNKIRPTHLVILSAPNSQPDLESELFENLQFGELIQVSGFINQIMPRYSAAQIRNFKILLYFHYTKFQNPSVFNSSIFNFCPLVMSHSPYQVSYCTDDSLNFKGISAVTFLENDHLHERERVDACQAVVMAIFTVNTDSYQNMMLEKKVSISSSDKAMNLIRGPLPEHAKFRGLTLVHSVDQEKHLFNLYTPLDVKTLLSGADEDIPNDVLILMRGKTEIPIEEIAPKSFYKSISTKDDVKLPFVTFDKHTGKGGKVLKVRRNIMRRSHQN